MTRLFGAVASSRLRLQYRTRMEIHVIHTAREAESEDFDGSLAVVIDVLRATTVLATLLASGANRIYPVRSVSDAFELKDRTPGALLCGERGGFPVEGFDHGNSPVTFGAMDLAGRTIILTTTNGTRAAEAASAAVALFAASLVNLSAVAESIARLSERSEGEFRDIKIVCSGTNDRYSIDDVYAAGLLCGKIAASPAADTLSDSALAATIVAAGDARDLISGSSHAGYLREHGLFADVEYALSIDTNRTVPRYFEGYFSDGSIR